MSIETHLIKTGKRSQVASLLRGSPNRQKMLAFLQYKEREKGGGRKEKRHWNRRQVSFFHGISHLFYNHGFQVVSSRQKCPTCMSLVFLTPDTELVGLLLGLHFSLGRAFPGVELPRKTATYSSGAAPHNFSGNLISHFPPPQ